MFYQRATLIHKWARKGNQPNVISHPGREKTGYFSMVNLITGRLITENADKFDQDSFKYFLDTILSSIKEEEK